MFVRAHIVVRKLRRRGFFMRLGTYVGVAGLCSVLMFPTTTTVRAGANASAMGNIRVSVAHSLRIVKTRDMDFGLASTGNSEMTLDPEQGKGAEFSVVGEPHKAYSIVLPHSITLTTGDGKSQTTRIEIKDFRSSPSRTGNLDPDGHQTLRIGATRQPIADDQLPGQYSGPFTVTLTYP